ncbi:MAG: bifunctional methylenetetrahydrofolate dehydrogenase/methenyltetrahydrofolate cyclohydrolase FolD [bacterium]
MSEIIDGKKISAEMKSKIKLEVDQLKPKGIIPGLAVVLVGSDPASKVYVSMKQKACGNLGIYSEEHKLEENTSQETLIELIKKLNADTKINGILVQLPLPRQIDTNVVLETIVPEKDVDGFHPYNIGKLVTGTPTFVACTPYGVIKLLEHSKIDMAGKEAVVIGRSNIVGKPVAILLMQKNATVTICHSKTKDLPAVCRRADILIAAIGRPKMITKEFVKKGAVVIDVGTNRLPDGTLCGDVDFDDVKDWTSMLTPVPGGVGPMTITMLMHNTVKSAKMANKIPLNPPFAKGK